MLKNSWSSDFEVLRVEHDSNTKYMRTSKSKTTLLSSFRLFFPVRFFLLSPFNSSSIAMPSRVYCACCHFCRLQFCDQFLRSLLPFQLRNLKIINVQNLLIPYLLLNITIFCRRPDIHWIVPTILVAFCAIPITTAVVVCKIPFLIYAVCFHTYPIPARIEGVRSDDS